MKEEEDKVITVNVGGKLFTTMKSNLKKSKFFNVIFENKLECTVDENNRIFVDRDPDLFSIILNYLRTNKIKNIENVDIEAYNEELDFYQLDVPKIVKLSYEIDTSKHRRVVICEMDLINLSLVDKELCKEAMRIIKNKKVIKINEENKREPIHKGYLRISIDDSDSDSEIIYGMNYNELIDFLKNNNYQYKINKNSISVKKTYLK